MPDLLIQFVNLFRPREGWIPLALVLIALLSPVAALIDANPTVGVEGLVVLTVLAVIVGLRLARSRLSARAAAALGTLLGIGLVVVVVGRLVPPSSLIWTEIEHTANWLSQWRKGVIGWPLPLASTTEFVWQRLDDLGVRLWWWSQTVSSGGMAQDPILFVSLTSLLAWAFGLFAVWQIYRRRNCLVGLLPAGLSVAVLAFFREGLPTFYLIAFLFCTLWLLAICHLWTRWDRWERTATDYPDDMGMELLLAVGPWLAAIVLLAAFTPVLHPRQISEAVWRVTHGPWSTVEEYAERLFGPIEGRGFGDAGADGSLPRAHLLGGSPELAETTVFYVTTDDPAPPLPSPEEELVAVESGLPRRYWRTLTYDIYTGQGWVNSPLEQRTSPSEQPLDPSLPPGPELLQQFDLVASGETLLPAANAPLRLDHSVQSWWRAPGDLVQLTSNASRYTAISRPPEPSVVDLRNALQVPPPHLAERYLALPETIPRRVLDLAQEVAGDAETQYDQAHAIEFFLRTYSYTLDLPSPPTDVDLVDYFLFDLQKGYCDYYASAMVVMARSAGIPARLATGYAQGTYDHDEERWAVTEKDGHSWAELYFDGIGWVEFEPTAGQPVLSRTGSDLAAPVVPPLPRRAPSGLRLPWALLVLGCVLILLVTAVILIWRPRQRGAASGGDLVRDRYQRLVRWGARIGHPLRDGQTAHEYGATLSEALHDRGQDSRWSQVRRASDEAPPEVGHLTDALVRAQYSPEPVDHREGWQIRDLWTRLRRHLWWLWLGRN